MLSRGDIPNDTNVVVEAIGNGEVKFHWSDLKGTNPAGPDDKCIAVIHIPDIPETRFSNDKKFREEKFVSEETRKSGSATLPLKLLLGETVETWLVFLSANGRDVANSVYTGPLVIL